MMASERRYVGDDARADAAPRGAAYSAADACYATTRVAFYEESVAKMRVCCVLPYARWRSLLIVSFILPRALDVGVRY